MNKPNVPKILKSVGSKVSKRSPEILTGIGIAGMMTTVALAVKATPKAISLIQEEQEALGVEQLPKKEIVKAAWKPYVPAAITGAASRACLIGAQSVNARRTAAFATAYKLSETAFVEYKDKVIETIGEKKEKDIRDKVAKDRIENHPVSTSSVIVTEKGNTLCYDAAAGRYFRSDIDRIKKAVNEINRRMVYDQYVSLNEFYDELGLDHTELGDDLGWNLDNGFVEIEFSSQIAEDGTPCIVISYGVAPRYDFAKLM